MDSKQTLIFISMIIISFIIFLNNPILGLLAVIISFIIGRVFNIINDIHRNEINKQIYKEMKERKKER